MNVRVFVSASNFMKALSCNRDLNSGPLPYQGSALPLSYYSNMSGKRGSNPRPPAWKASALSTELFPRKALLRVGGDGFEPPKSKDSRFTVCPIWPLWKLPFALIAFQRHPVRGNRLVTTYYLVETGANLGIISELKKLFPLFFGFRRIFLSIAAYLSNFPPRGCALPYSFLSSSKVV